MSDLQTKITITGVDRVSAITQQISRSLDALKVNSVGLSNAWAKTSMVGSQIVSQLRNLTLVTFAAGAGVFSFTKRFAEMGEEINKASQRTGIAIDKLQEWQYVAKLSGVATDDLNNSLKFLNRSIANAAADPTSAAAIAFNSMGIAVRNADGSLKDASQVMLSMSDVYARNADGAKKVQTGMVTMGRGGTALIPVLNEGSVAINKQMMALTQYGHVLDKVEIAQGTHFLETYRQLTTTIEGVAEVIALNLIPVLEPILVGFRDWLALNKQFVAVKVKTFIVDFGEGLKTVWNALKNVSNVLIPVIQNLGGLRTIIEILVGLYIASFTVKLFQLVVGLAQVAVAVKNLSVAFLSSPITWVVAGLALIGVALVELYLHWDAVKQMVKSIWPTVQPYFEVFMSVITLGMYNVAKSIYNNWGTIAPFLMKTMDKIFAYFGFSFNNFSKTVGDIFSALKKTILDFVDWAAAPFAKLDKMLGGALFAVAGKKSGYDPLAVTGPNGGKNTNPIANPIPNTFGTNISLSNPLGSLQNNATRLTQPAVVDNTDSKYNNLNPQTQGKLDIYMQIDQQGRPQKVTAKSPDPIAFTANTGIMI